MIRASTLLIVVALALTLPKAGQAVDLDWNSFGTSDYYVPGALVQRSSWSSFSLNLDRAAVRHDILEFSARVLDSIAGQLWWIRSAEIGKMATATSNRQRLCQSRRLAP